MTRSWPLDIAVSWYVRVQLLLFGLGTAIYGEFLIDMLSCASDSDLGAVGTEASETSFFSFFLQRSVYNNVRLLREMAGKVLPAPSDTCIARLLSTDPGARASSGFFGT
ncbi:hypothetical protein NX059_006061 [Plenodomus lindquistii]|nr:hypothetical protein NX059_006061 [Plenodomus lindquistii]